MYTTPEVCTRLGCTPAALNSWLSRHEKYKPAQRTPPVGYGRRMKSSACMRRAVF